jgi:hypothetical protein
MPEPNPDDVGLDPQIEWFFNPTLAAAYLPGDGKGPTGG